MLHHQTTQFLIQDLVSLILVETDELVVTPELEIDSTLLRNALDLGVKTNSKVQDLSTLDVQLAIEVNRDVESIIT